MNEAYKIIENIKLSDINAFPVSSRTFCDSPRFPGEKKRFSMVHLNLLKRSFYAVRYFWWVKNI